MRHGEIQKRNLQQGAQKLQQQRIALPLLLKRIYLSEIASSRRTLHVDQQIVVRIARNAVGSLPVLHIHEQKRAARRILRVALEISTEGDENLDVGRNAHLVVLDLVHHDVRVLRQTPVHNIEVSTLKPIHHPHLPGSVGTDRR